MGAALTNIEVDAGSVWRGEDVKFQQVFRRSHLSRGRKTPMLSTLA
ncbi:hypothetical protein CKA32_004330 [Geitlerinema sp. FC II]|nr:hypothetical protein CKA32_004330 [Geitlerinema sp. FC II]